MNEMFRFSLFTVVLSGVAMGQEPIKIVNTQKGTLSNARDSLNSIRLPKGFKVSLFAAEPDVQQPIAVTTDERGRIWIAENYTYAEQGYDTTTRDRVIILDDTNNDGKFDKRTVFWDKAQHLTSVEVGYGGVWLLCAPHLLFIPDKNKDDKPDGPPVVLLEGFDFAAIGHNIVNGLKWGPDGWLYGRHGITATSKVGKPGAAESNKTVMNCSIWRFHPQRHVFEVVTRGTTNPWGFDYDDYGQMFFINTVIGHMWHVVPGAHFKRMFGTDFDPHLYQLIDQTADHFHWDTKERWSDAKKGLSDSTDHSGGGHAHCGMMIYLGDNWPDKYRNELFTINLHGRRINQDHLEREHNGYVGRHRPDLIHFDDEWFRGVELFYGPDGGVFVMDWTDIGECHERDGVHRTSGRIFKITYGEPSTRATDMNKLDEVTLAELQLHNNDWWVRQSRRLLHERALAGKDMKAAASRLQQIYRNRSDVRKRLRAMWTLHLVGAVDQEWLREQTYDEEEHIRVWALRLLVDQGVDNALVEEIRRLAADSSGLVRLFVASALQQVPSQERWSIAQRLCGFADDDHDRMQPLMVWYAVEPAVISYPAEAIQLMLSSKLGAVREHISRRLMGEIERTPDVADKVVLALASASDNRTRKEILTGMQKALDGWRKTTPPRSWAATSKTLVAQGDPSLAKSVNELSVVFGDGRALASMTNLVKDSKADVAARRKALQVLIQSRNEGLLKLLKGLVSNRELGDVAVRGLTGYEDKDVPKSILKTYPRLTPVGKEAAIDTLSSRATFSSQLLDAVERGVVNRNELSAFHARQIYGFGDARLQARLVEVWGPVRQTSAERKAQIAQLQARLTADRLKKADAEVGKRLFEKNCANCHTLYGKGGRIGPDLTGANRKNLYYLLENMVDPSGSVAKPYRVSLVRLENGQVVSGIVLNKTGKTTTIQTPKEKLVLQNEEIAEAKLHNDSLMPDNLLSLLKDREIADLIAFLMAQ